MHCCSVEQLLSKMKDNNQMFSEEQVDLLKNITWCQHPKITLVTCSDSRVDANYFKMNSVDKIFTIRNIWNAILTSEGSVDYWVEHLETPILLVLGHTNCWAIHTALNWYHKVTTDIQRELNQLMPALINLKENELNKRWLEWVEKNLELQVQIAENKFKERLEKSKLTIIWAILDINDSYSEWIWKIHFKKIVWNHKCDFDIEY